MSEFTRPANRLLSALPEKEYQKLFPKLERISLILKEHIYQQNGVIRYIYFPESGIISLLSATSENSMLEVGIVGNEGMIGLPVFLGIKTSNNLALVQGAGFALRIPATDFLKMCRNNSSLSKIMHRFTHSLFTQISQSAACNRFHRIEPRLSRWLLMMHDRMKTDEFQITQELLSNMLGVRREAVNIAATNLQRRQLITYHRGSLSILNRPGLEVAACSCYKIIRKDYDDFLN